jgi:hypothetical protein
MAAAGRARRGGRAPEAAWNRAGRPHRRSASAAKIPPVVVVAKHLEVSEATYHHWHTQYGAAGPAHDSRGISPLRRRYSYRLVCPDRWRDRPYAAPGVSAPVRIPVSPEAEAETEPRGQEGTFPSG